MAQTTTLARDSQRVRVTLPRRVAEAIDVGDRKARDQLAVRFAVDCPVDNSLPIAFRFGPDIEGGPATRAGSHYASSGQTQLGVPLFVAAAWNLLDQPVRWPDAETVRASADEAVELESTVDEWTPTQPVDPWDVAGDSYGSTLSKYEHEAAEKYEANMPLEVARALELDVDREASRVAVSAACVGDRVVLVVEPDVGGDSSTPTSLSVYWGGPQDNQPRFAGQGVATVLGVHDRLDEGSVDLQWVVNDGYAVVFVEDGDSE